jgi:threonine/homoserine/homoserine lactone efflux protein
MDILLDILPLIFAFAITSTVIELTPGPNMGYLAVLSATNGRRAGFAAVAGIALGLLVLGIAAALGLAAAIAASPILYQFIRWAGIAYLFWLAYEGWQESTEPISDVGREQENPIKYFLRGLGTNLLNPKAALFYVVMLPTFISPDHSVKFQTVILSFIFVVIATLIHTFVVALAGYATDFLNNPRRYKLARRVLSIALALIAIWFTWSTRM